MKERKSNFELMRIISMLMIIVWHIIIHGNLLNNTTGPINFCLNFILSICVVHVNSFVILSGYFNYDKKFKYGKILSLLNSAFFYNVIIVVTFTCCNLINLTNVEVIKQISYLPFSEYWFIKYYIVLYCFSPFLNLLISAMNQKQFKNLLIVSLIIFSILPTFSGQQIFSVEMGFSLYHFIFMYLIGAYLRIYPIERSSIFMNLNKRKMQTTLLILFLILAILNLSLLCLSGIFYSFNSNIFYEIGEYLNLGFRSYSNVIVVLQSACYVLLFSTLNVKNKRINYISSFVFGVYLIHDNSIVRKYIYKWLGIDMGIMISSNLILFKVLFIATLIFVMAIIIEFLRKKIFNIISNCSLYKFLYNKLINFVNSFTDNEKETKSYLNLKKIKY